MQGPEKDRSMHLRDLLGAEGICDMMRGPETDQSMHLRDLLGAEGICDMKNKHSRNMDL